MIWATMYLWRQVLHTQVQLYYANRTQVVELVHVTYSSAVLKSGQCLHKTHEAARALHTTVVFKSTVSTPEYRGVPGYLLVLAQAKEYLVSGLMLLCTFAVRSTTVVATIGYVAVVTVHRLTSVPGRDR
jgi:hypothetical protein